jgi:asparagine synthase (glutamine-hydrolysing)
MCGIAGFVGFAQFKMDKNDFERFTISSKHRGPDQSNTILLENDSVALGHTRLSILDLSVEASQPLSDNTGRYYIIYNGEVFNFLELKKDLIQLGYNFISESDTEVIIAAYTFWGKDCLYKFNGMWAIAIWDNKEKKIWLARDRFGIKPLYYTLSKNYFAFASETNAFKHLSIFNRELDEVNASLAIQDCFSVEGLGKSIYKNIQSLLPGHWMEIDLIGNVKYFKWWETKQHLIDVPTSYDDQIKLFKSILFDSCRIRLRSDVPIATALSGGLDSSSVYSIIKSISNDGSKNVERVPISYLQAFSAIFPGTEQDEKKYAAMLFEAYDNNINWIQEDERNMVSKIENSIKHLDFIYNTPLFMGSSVYEAMSNKGIKVSLDGHGVDEMMFGYAFSIKNMADSLVSQNAAIAIELWEVYSQMIVNRPLVPGYYKDELKIQNRFIHKAKNYFKEKLSHESQNFGFDLLYQQFHHTMLPTILRNFDKMSMQHGVEIRMPFMDHRLVTYVLSLPFSSKIGGGFTKKILRDSMKGILPEQIRSRKNKIGLNAPMQTWFSGPLKEYINDEVNSIQFQTNPILNGRSWTEFLELKNKNSNWSFQEALSFWPVLNTHILIKN